MRVAIRRKFHVLFAYTLEMSYGGCNFGPEDGKQFTPDDFRDIGVATAKSIKELLIDGAVGAGREAMLLYRPDDDFEKVLTRTTSRISCEGSCYEENPTLFSFSCQDISITEPYAVTLNLKQMKPGKE
jgi:hypothetical protein